MFRRDRYNRLVRMTPSNQFTSVHTEIFNDSVGIDLTHGRLPQTFYRGTGPFESLFGWAWGAFGVELSPGRDYLIRIQTVQTGFPFYNSGCRSGDDWCEGESVEAKAFSEPLDIKFRASEQVKRGFWRWYRDLRQSLSF
jgi:hypothetical protein